LAVVSRRSRRALRAAGALAALLLAACERAAPRAPAAPGAADASANSGAAAAPIPAAREPAGAAAPSVAAFDVGEIKSAAEYLQDPAFASADVARGELLSLACAACHTFATGQKTLIGPNLHGVFGRPAGTVAGFDYSDGLRASGLVWTPRALEAWLADPARFVAGTKMAFSGYRSAEDRRHLIAYLLRATQ
jgi:cytochrome c